MSEAFAGLAGAVDERLEIAFEMRPAPLQAAESPVHPRPVTMDDTVKVVAEQLLRHVGASAGAAGKEGEAGSDEGPDPGFGGALLGRRFIDVQHGLPRKLLGQFVIGRLYGVGGVVLQQHQPTGAGWLVEYHAQKMRRPAFGLAKAGHEEAGEGDQPRPGLTRGDAGWQGTAGRATAHTDEPVLLVFGNARLDFGEFPDLMAERLGIRSRQGLATASAGGRHAGDDLLAVRGRNQSPLVFWVVGLAARLALRFGLGP